MFQERFYRNSVLRGKLINFEVIEEETDLLISAEKDLKMLASERVSIYRKIIKDYIKKHPEFQKSLTPLAPDLTAQPIIQAMLDAGTRAGVGPMAAVAGAIAEYVGRDLLAHSNEIIIENGGDIFINSAKERLVSIYAGTSKLSNKIGIRLMPPNCPVGLCTSSGTVGHSLSFGRADACVIKAKSAIIADAYATKLGNMVATAEDLQKTIQIAKNISDIDATLIIVGEHMAVSGDFEIVRLP